MNSEIQRERDTPEKIGRKNIDVRFPFSPPFHNCYHVPGLETASFIIKWWNYLRKIHFVFSHWAWSLFGFLRVDLLIFRVFIARMQYLLLFCFCVPVVDMFNLVSIASLSLSSSRCVHTIPLMGELFFRFYNSCNQCCNHWNKQKLNVNGEK